MKKLKNRIYQKQKTERGRGFRMKILTKLNILDDGFFMKDNKVFCESINDIEIRVFLQKGPLGEKELFKEFYKTKEGNALDSGKIFKTKQDLLDSL